MLKATKVDGVYSADPLKHSDATLFERLTFDEALGRKLAVMDATALVLCSEHNMPVRVFNIFEPGHLARIVAGEHRITSYNVCYTKLLRSGVWRPAIRAVWCRIHSGDAVRKTRAHRRCQDRSGHVITSYSIHYTKLYEFSTTLHSVQTPSPSESMRTATPTSGKSMEPLLRYLR